LAFEAQNVFNHPIVAGPSPLAAEEYALTKIISGQSVLVITFWRLF
jgi:hypothetical protein